MSLSKVHIRIGPHVRGVPSIAMSSRFAESLGMMPNRILMPAILTVLMGVAARIDLYTGLERLIERWMYAYNHGYLVLSMSAWLAVLGLRRRPELTLRPSVTALLGTAGLIASTWWRN
jgi:hypothetical protein